MSNTKTPLEADFPWVKSYPDEVRWDKPIVPHPVYDILDETARDYGSRPAFDFLGKKWKWSEISDLVNRMAEGLQGMGVVKGTKVGLFLPNCTYFLIGYYAILKAGGTVVNYNPLYAPRELHHQIEDSQTDIMITLDLAALYDKMHQMLHETRLRQLVICPFADILPFPKNLLFPIVKRKEVADLEHPEHYVLYKDLIDNDGKPKPVKIDPETDTAVLQYTGGTTGVPKGAELTHANISANVEQAITWFFAAKKGQERMVGILPFFHVFAMTAVMNMSVRCAFEIIALPRFDLEETLKVIHKKKPQYCPAVPAIYSAINNHKNIEKYDLTSLKYCISGGAPLPVEVKKSFEEKTGCVVVEGYGLSESSPIVCINPIKGKNKAGSIGLPVAGTIVEIVDPEDKKTLVKKGERGELCVRGPQVMKAYWNKPEETEDVIRNGRLHTGDIATMDDDGYVYIVDRIKDLIITNGYNVYPRNVEDAIYLHPSVEECIVAGIPCDSRGETVKAWVKRKAGTDLDAEDIKSSLVDKLSKIEIPRQIIVRDEPLPKTMVGKLSRKDMIAEDQKADA